MNEVTDLKEPDAFALFGNEFVKLNDYLSISKINELYIWNNGLIELRLRNPSPEIIDAFYKLKSDLHGVDIKYERPYVFRIPKVYLTKHIVYSSMPSFVRNKHEEWIDTLFGNDSLSLTGPTIYRAFTAQHDGSIRLKLKTRMKNKTILEEYIKTIDFKIGNDVSDPNIIDIVLIRDHGSYDKDGIAYFDDEFLSHLH